MTQKEITSALIGKRLTFVNLATEKRPESRTNIRIKVANWRKNYAEWYVGNLRCGVYLTTKAVTELILNGKIKYDRFSNYELSE